jgi:oligopeptide/dipeptide ABC transporter ATP-binding protein
MPYTEALVNSIPKLNNPSHTVLEVIPGRPPDLVNPPKGCKFSPRCKYVQDRCREEAPPLIEAETPGHAYRCFYPVGTPEGEEALARNLAKLDSDLEVVGAPAGAADEPVTPTTTKDA